ncbi:MAG: hypothetical protein QNJ38_09155 [Prochloraceae cyanobacterium]|nr:hypothetical protein [Prochloraceae cyanobacterium]
MGITNRQSIRISTIFLCLLLIILNVALASCSDRSKSAQIFDTEKIIQDVSTVKIQEVTVPETIEQLARSLKYQPEIDIISPKQGENIDQDKVNVKLQVKDLPVYLDSDLKLGPHLSLILDDRERQEIYDLKKEITFSNLTAGFHTIRVLALTPWNESFKNKKAYAIASFNIVEEESEEPEPQNRDLSSLPILTYNSPYDNVAAEPILLDFYLSNVNLKQDETIKIEDYQVEVTIGEDSFMLDRIEPVYLTGFDRGKNSIKLELVDRLGNPLDGDFSSVIEEFTYQPNPEDSLSKILEGKISAEVATKIIDPDYKIAVPDLVEKKSESSAREILTQESNNSELESDSEIIEETELESEAESDSEIIEETELESEAESNSEIIEEIELEPETESDSEIIEETELEPETESDSEIIEETELEPETESDSEIIEESAEDVEFSKNLD